MAMRLPLLLLISFWVFIGFVAPLIPGWQDEKFALVKKTWDGALNKSNLEISEKNTFEFKPPGLDYGPQSPEGKDSRLWIRITFLFTLGQANPIAVPETKIQSNDRNLEISFRKIATERGQILKFIEKIREDSHIKLIHEVGLRKAVEERPGFTTFKIKLDRPYEWRFNYLVVDQDNLLIAYVDFRDKAKSAKSGAHASTPPKSESKSSSRNSNNLAALLENLPANADPINEAFKYFKTPPARLPDKFDEVITGVTNLNKRDRCYGYQFMFRFLTEVLIPQRPALLADKNAVKTINNKIDGFSPELSHDEVFFFELCKRLALQKAPAVKETASAWKAPISGLSNNLDVEYYSVSPDSGKWEHFIHRMILVERPGQRIKNRSANLDELPIGELFQSWPAKELKIVLLSKFKTNDIGKNFIRRTYDKLLLEVTGAYTSENECIVGLAFQQGQQVGFLPREWEGVLIIDADGKPQITSLADLREGDLNNNPGKGEPLAIFQNAEDFMKFIKIVGAKRLSFLQSHLLVHRGKYDDKLNRSAGAKRRVLAQFNDGTFAVINFFRDDLSLHKCARILAEIGVQEAINLDSGSYDVCRIYNVNNVPYEDRSYKNIEARENLISNKLILHY
jgi:hypothetical protein